MKCKYSEIFVNNNIILTEYIILFLEHSYGKKQIL